MDPVASIENSLDNLEEVLAPLLDKSFSQTISKLDLLQQTKLQVLLPYVVNDLVFIYLKTKGINPKTHPVVGELDRVKQYFDKIKKAENPDKKRFAVDQEAATRFIKHAIKESQAVLEKTQHGVKQNTHTRFMDVAIEGTSASAAALAKIQARANESRLDGSDSEESDLEVFADDAALSEKDSTNVIAETTVETLKPTTEASTGKKRRRGIDPWTGALSIIYFIYCFEVKSETWPQGYDETKADATLVPVHVPQLEERHNKKSRCEDSTSEIKNSIVQADSEPAKAEESGKAKVIGGTIAKKKLAAPVVEIIDVDALSESSRIQGMQTLSLDS
ncbi:C1D-domain-containing protein [Ramaria rubella]|nr:C1D-domain-containing protein [Ramaria rubella]